MGGKALKNVYTERKTTEQFKEIEQKLLPILQQGLDTELYIVKCFHTKETHGDMDILGSACMSSKIAWYENDGSQEFIKHSLGYFAGALWLDATDLDNDGDRDLFGAAQGASTLAWGISILITAINVTNDIFLLVTFIIGILLYGLITGAALMWVLKPKEIK